LFGFVPTGSAARGGAGVLGSETREEVTNSRGSAARTGRTPGTA
jgi:hypothetical protein